MLVIIMYVNCNTCWRHLLIYLFLKFTHALAKQTEVGYNADTAAITAYYTTTLKVLKINTAKYIKNGTLV